MKPTFTIKLGQPVLPGLAVTGKFDGKTPSIACATTGGKVVIHSPYDSSGGASSSASAGPGEGSVNPLRYLNLNRKISAMAAGPIGVVDGENTPHALFIGTQSNLLAYDVERNADLFFVDVQDGANVLSLGKLGNRTKNSVIVGGNCSLLGFDERGEEIFWSVAADNVSSLTLYDADSNGQNLLLAGSDDFEIRMYRGEEIVSENSEADRVVALHAIAGPKFAYSLANGTVGVYSNPKTRQWRVKTKHQPTALFAYDIDMDGVAEIFSGWSNGSFNVRRQDNGEVIFRETMDGPIAGIFKADYRMDGHEEVIICAESGNISAYLPTDTEFGAMLDTGIAKETAADQKLLDELHAQKLELLSEWKLLEKATKSKGGDVPVGALPPNTALSYELRADLDCKAVALKVEVNTDCQIANIVAIDLEGGVLVNREAIAVSVRSMSRSAILPLRPERNYACKIRLQTHVAMRNLASQLHVFETDIAIPKFAAFAQLQDFSQFTQPRGVTSFTVKDSLESFSSWLQSSFIVTSNVRPSAIEEKLRVGFMSVCPTSSGLSAVDSAGRRARDMRTKMDTVGEMFVIQVTRVNEQGLSSTKVRILCDNMDLVADVVQDMEKYFNWQDLESEAEFPAEFEQFEQVLRTVAECNATRTTLTADMADDAQRIKALIVRAEDSRLMMDMSSMRKVYTELNAMNSQMIVSYNIRSNNHETLLAALKEVNQMIQKAANLRVGKAKARVVTDCRAAVKNNNMQALFRIMKNGFDPSSAASASAAAQAKK